MESIGDKQVVRPLLLTWKGLATGLLCAAAIGGALLYSAGRADATPVDVPGIGQFEIADALAAQLGIPAAAPELAPESAPQLTPAESPAAEQSVLETFEFRPVTIPGVRTAEVPAVIVIPQAAAPAAVPELLQAPEISAPVPAPATAADSRQVTLAGLGDFLVPNFLPPLAGIPGLTDAAVAQPAPLPAAMPKKSVGQRAVDAARTRLGAGYSSGAVGPDAFDCSGLVQWSYRQAGVELPRTSYSQLSAGTPVSVDELEPGDLVSFYGGGHSALYVGDGQVIHASTYGSGVKISPMDNMPVTGARRF